MARHRRRSSWAAIARFGHAAREYLFKPVQGAVRNHVNAAELLDAILAGLASGGLSNAILYLAQHQADYLTGLDPTYASIYVSSLMLLARLVQRYFHEDRLPPVQPS